MHGLKEVRPASTSAGMPEKPRSRSSRTLTGLLIVSVLVLTAVAYAPVIFDFFAGDDYVHLRWLREAVVHPELILRNFHTSWLDGTTTKFYRPLISVFMYTDYLVGGSNGLMFHLTNLAFHLFSTAFLFLIIEEAGTITSRANDQRESPAANRARALLGSLVFGLYPLHPEAVSWITGRVDSVVTAFCLGAVWCYMRWRTTARAPWFVATLAFTTLGLLSKEMAITLPAVYVCIELFLAPGKSTGDFRPRNLVRQIANLLAPLKHTLAFWALLGLYFVVRLLALKTLVGGYDNSLFFIANLKDFALSWLHALRMFLEPINRTLIGVRDPLTRAWEGCLALSAGSIAVAFFTGACRRQFLFASSWLVLSLIPVYKIFAISDDLQGSRLAYLATAPLAVLFSLAFVSWQQGAIPKKIGITLGLVVSGLCLVLLQINNKPWIWSGTENSKIQSGLSRLYKNIQGDPQVLFISLPDQINGAYTCRNSLDGMTKRPQMERDVNNCLMINGFEPIFPFGFLKESIAAERDSVKIFRWNSRAKEFFPVATPAKRNTPEWSVNTAQLAVTPAEDCPARVARAQDGSISITTGAKPAGVYIRTGLQDCWKTDLVQVEFTALQVPATPRAGIELLYSNEISEDFELKKRAHADFEQPKGNQVLTFALRGLPEWSLGGSFDRFKLLLPANSAIQLKSICSVAHKNLMPIIAFENSGYLGSKGFLHLGPAQKEQTVYVNYKDIPGALSADLEITRANLLFEEQNSKLESAVQAKKEPVINGKVALKFKDFSSPGIYEIRARALGKDGRIVGVSSDHIVISVDTQ